MPGFLCCVEQIGHLHCLWFHTDARSTKARQLTNCPYACSVCYDHRDGVQLRVWGAVTLHQGNEVAERHWEQTEFHVRHAYAMACAPGQPLPRRDPRMQVHQQQLATNNLEQGRRNFAVIELMIEGIEWLQVGDTEDRRAVMRSVDDWQVEPLAP